MAQRLNSLPIIYVKGTHYDIGYKIGLTFKSMIQDLLLNYDYLNNLLIPSYESSKGRKIYEDTFAVVEDTFPQYIEEMQGTAIGAEVPFFKLFLLHLDMILSFNMDNDYDVNGSTGCSTILCNQPGNLLIGHNEDALTDILNHCYIVHAHVQEPNARGKWRVREEKFSSLCYAGHLPGFCMSANRFGLIFSVNIVVPKLMLSGKIPRHFLTRALLSAHNVDQVVAILQDKGNGIGDGVSINFGFLNDQENQLLYNIEVGSSADKNESVHSIKTVHPGETYFHCNCYKHLSVACRSESCLESSKRRERVYAELVTPTDTKSTLEVLGNNSDSEYPIFRDGLSPDIALTALTGIFDLHNKTWSLYNENPRDATEPLCRINLDLI